MLLELLLVGGDIGLTWASWSASSPAISSCPRSVALDLSREAHHPRLFGVTWCTLRTIAW
jgi:hypothetical protein